MLKQVPDLVDLIGVIYGLRDPTINEIRYVGYTRGDTARRLWWHLHEAQMRNTCHRHRWLRSLLNQGLKPTIVVLEIVADDWKLREKYWIATLPNLVNSTEGSEGLINPSLETRAKISGKVS
jgi:hypothetical protein